MNDLPQILAEVHMIRLRENDLAQHLVSQGMSDQEADQYLKLQLLSVVLADYGYTL